MHKNHTLLTDKCREALSSVLPVTLIVMLLCFTITPISGGMLMSFLFGAALLVFGMGLFTLGVELAMTPMGEYVGTEMTRSRKIWNVIGISLFVGIMITLSEPDLQVLAEQVPTIPNLTLILSVSVGVGFFLVVALLRILFHVPLRILLWLFYPIVFILSAFVGDAFQAVSFDAGGVTTGPMTVPFIMALGVGVSAIRSDRDAGDDSFGLVALCSIGPILAVLVLGIFYPSDSTAYTADVYAIPADSGEMFRSFARMIPHYIKEVTMAVGPLVVFFFVYQMFHTKIRSDRMWRIIAGIVYTYVGLVLFLTGANVGFMPAGKAIGASLGETGHLWLVIPIGAIIGYFIVAAEPAVHVLKKQVEDITAGAIPQKALAMALSFGVAASVAIGMLRAMTGISLFWFLVPGYALALLLPLFVPPIFTAIAFDSGGVASGTMTATFLLPFTMGVCEASGGSVVTDAFGIVSLVAMTPLIAIQILGLVYKRRLRRGAAVAETAAEVEDVIDLTAI